MHWKAEPPRADCQFSVPELLIILLEIISSSSCHKALGPCRFNSKSHIEYCADGSLAKGRRQIGALDTTLHNIPEVVEAHPGPKAVQTGA